MDKYIIHNQTTLDEATAFERVIAVVRQGRISQTSNGIQHCFASRFPDCMVTVKMNCSGTETFTIQKP